MSETLQGAISPASAATHAASEYQSASCGTTPEHSPAKLNGFAAVAQSPYSAEAEDPAAFEFQYPQHDLPPYNLPTVHSGTAMDPVRDWATEQAQLTKAAKEVKQSSSWMSWKRTSSQPQLPIRENSEVANGSAMVNKIPSATGLGSKFNGKSLSEKPASGALARANSARNPDAEPARPFWMMPRTFSLKNSKRSNSFDMSSMLPDLGLSRQPSSDLRDNYGTEYERLQETSSPDAKQRDIATAELNPFASGSAAPSQPSSPGLTSRPRHRRTQSSGSQVDTRPTSAGSGGIPSLRRILSCTSPSVQDDAEVSEKVAVLPDIPNAGLMNFGNTCFLNSLCQVFYHTPFLRELLCPSFPAVGAPHPPPQHEPLSEYVLPKASRPAESAGASTPRGSTDGSATSAAGASPKQVTARTSPSGSVESNVSSSNPSTNELVAPKADQVDAAPASFLTTVQPSPAGQPAQGHTGPSVAGTASPPEQMSSTPSPAEAAAEGGKPAETQEQQAQDGVKLEVQQMAERARSHPIAKGQLRLALAYQMKTMFESAPDSPVNPFIVYWAAAMHDRGEQRIMDGNQQDIHEFFTLFKDWLLADEEDMLAPASVSVNGKVMQLRSLKDLFKGKRRDRHTCKLCNVEVLREAEDFWDIPVCPGGKNYTLEACIKRFGKSPVEGPCPVCDTKKKNRNLSGSMVQNLTAAVRYSGKSSSRTSVTEITELPLVLVVHLKRTKVELATNPVPFKDHSRVIIDHKVKLWDLMSEDAKLGLNEEDSEYKLYSLVFHQGSSTTTGHYYNISRTGPLDEHWCKFDDHRVSRLEDFLRPNGKIQLKEKEMQEVCMCFFVRSNLQPANVPASSLSSAG